MMNTQNFAYSSEEAQTLAWYAYLQQQQMTETDSSSFNSASFDTTSFAGSNSFDTPISAPESPVDLLPFFEDIDTVGVSRGAFCDTDSENNNEAMTFDAMTAMNACLAAYETSAFVDTVVMKTSDEVAFEHAQVMASASLQEKRKLANKFASLLQLNGVRQNDFTAFEHGDERVRQELNLVLFKAGLNVQTVMSEYWGEVAAVTNSSGQSICDIMDHNKRMKNYFEVNFQEYAGALSWDLSPKMGSPVAIRAMKAMNAQGGDKKATQAALVEDLKVKAERVATFKKTLWAQFEQFVSIKTMSFADMIMGGEETVSASLCELLHPQNEEKRTYLLTAFLENEEILKFTTGFVESNGLVVQTKKQKIVKL